MKSRHCVFQALLFGIHLDNTIYEALTIRSRLFQTKTKRQHLVWRDRVTVKLRKSQRELP